MKHSRGWLLAFCLLMIGCLVLPALLPEDAALSTAAQAAGKIKLNKSSVKLEAGETYQLKLKNAEKKIKWKSSDKKVATVSKSGLVTAKKAGTAVITAKSGGKKYTCKIRVSKPSVLSVSAKEVTLKKGKSKTVNISFSLTGVKLEVSSDDAEVVDLSLAKAGKGVFALKIKGLKAGSAVITVRNAKTKDKATIQVTVKGKGSKTGGNLTGDIQGLFGLKLEDALAQFADEMTENDGFWVNKYCGLQASGGKVDHLYVNKGTRYSLFGITPGMEWDAAVSRLAELTDFNWKEVSNEGSYAIFQSEVYSKRLVYMKNSGGRVELVHYYTDSNAK